MDSLIPVLDESHLIRRMRGLADGFRNCGCAAMLDSKAKAV